ncbi:MAG: class I SAM-dependent methyltransferase [Chloroflexi bacterium]|nr:MAG: class I SAM-dependent methyltransferase [Chloroflexota bacterium]
MVHKTSDRTWIKEFYDSAAEWWGESWYEGENLEPRLALVERFAGSAPKNLLELGAGPGETAAFLAAAGYQVTAVDISKKNFMLLSTIEKKNPNVTAVLGDFFTVSITGKFDAVCLFESFGMGTDQEQRNLLRRISAEWLSPDGVVIMDVYHPFWPIKKAGSSQHLNRLENVAGSVEMTERSYYDSILNRWIDEWEPVGSAADTRRQSVRCYTPADLNLLLEGTGFRIGYTEIGGEAFDSQPTQVSTSSPMDDFAKGYSYVAVLIKDH